MTTSLEALDLRESQEPLPVGTAFQKAQELYRGLNVEARPFGNTLLMEEKTVNLEDGSRIGITMITGISNNSALVSIVDNKTGISVQCGISANGGSEIRLSFPPKRVKVSGVIVPEDYANHDIVLNPEPGDEERVMSDLVDWASKSLSENKVTKPPYELEDVRVQIKSSRTPTSQLA